MCFLQLTALGKEVLTFKDKQGKQANTGISQYPLRKVLLDKGEVLRSFTKHVDTTIAVSQESGARKPKDGKL